MDIGAEKYVSITTFRKTGVGVSTPVWIAKLPDGKVGFTIDADSGKAKRLRNNSKVTLRPCNVKGKVADAAGEVIGTGALVTGAEYKVVWHAIVHKYWIVGSLMGLWAALTGWIKKSNESNTAVVITLDVNETSSPQCAG
jgi:uncharacterized protein